MNKPCDKIAPTSDDINADSVEDALDEALAEGFPASDPVAIDIEHPPNAAQVKQ